MTKRNLAVAAAIDDLFASQASSSPLADEDTLARERALDVTRSFLVQAPAGSGKTELLIQRLLALLSRVDRPERIFAVTFTRKAAGEMRERVIAALQDAQSGVRIDTTHGQRTRDLALAALAQDQRHDWQLVSHPSRLQVLTIDALSASIARAAPLATRLGAAPRCEENADAIYRHAARDALLAAHIGDSSWQRLLAHLDNDADAVVHLLSIMLSKRDQWLGKLSGGDAASMRAALEAVLAKEIEGELVAAHAAFPATLARELAEHERYASANLAADPGTASLARVLSDAAAAGGVPLPALDRQDDWRMFAAWLMRSDGSAFLKQMKAAKGFPPKGSGIGATHRHTINGAMQDLLDRLAAVPRLADTLDAARRLPSPEYGEESWAIVAALLDVLPQVAAHLALTFRADGAIDFVENALAALAALGSDDAPSDLLLRLDQTVHHLLIDEFQDTSFTQLDLIRRLTAGWQANDGRTLFAVGDPMQSIYRFREAEVRLFIEAQERQRIAGVVVECLTLRRNFRSHGGLVEWVNSIFPEVLGARSDPWRGVVAFAEATAAISAKRGPGVTFDAFRDGREEASAVVEQVRASLAAGAASIAVLVRARLHLEDILPALRAAQIEFEAVDLDIFGQRPAIQDLTSLTHALIQPADRLAWLAVLRAPWCGLSLPDLFAVAAAADGSLAKTTAAVVCAAQPIAGLSEDGRERLARAAEALVPALESRGRASLSMRVRSAWLALGGPACLDEAVDGEAAQSFFELLARHETGGDLGDWDAFIRALGALRSQPSSGGSRVQVMTLHRAKGLQFDTVIMPALARNTSPGGADLLRWRGREQGLLLAPMTRRGGDDDPLYAYLTSLANDEEDAELGRLLYVGCTRAKERLHLTAVLETEQDPAGAWRWKEPSASALVKLWPRLAATVAAPRPPAANAATVAPPPILLSRVPVAWRGEPQREDVPAAPSADFIAEEAGPPFNWVRETARHIGTVVHRLLAEIAQEGLDRWTAERIAAIRSRVSAELMSEGIDDARLSYAASEVEAALRHVAEDERGRWLFAPSHDEARSEWALAGVDNGAIVHIAIDRTFVADGARWIVDFKTGRHEGADLERFLDEERERYRPQLERYARLIRNLDPRPIRLALYYPLHGGWREWAFAD